MSARLHTVATFLTIALVATLLTNSAHAQRGGGGARAGGGGGMCQGAGGSIGTGIPTSMLPGYSLPYSYMPYYQMPYSLPYLYTPSRTNYGAGNAVAYDSGAPATKTPKVTRQSVLAQFDKDGNGKLEGGELKAARLAASERRRQR